MRCQRGLMTSSDGWCRLVLRVRTLCWWWEGKSSVFFMWFLLQQFNMNGLPVLNRLSTRNKILLKVATLRGGQ